MQEIEYYVTSVFTRNGRNGNGLAVVPSADGLSAASMQTIAKKLGFSETSFLLSPEKGDDYRVRFFTPEVELPFAGHPSIGTLFTMLKLGMLKMKRSYIQRIGERRIPMSVTDDGVIYMDQGEAVYGKRLAAISIAAMLGVLPDDVAGEAQVVSTGLPLLLVPLRSYGALRSSSIRRNVHEKIMHTLGARAVMPFTVYRGKLRSRMYAPALGIKEDPATGSGAGPLASFAVREGYVKPYGGSLEVLQGMGTSASLLLARLGKTSVKVGGHSRLLGKHTLKLAE